MRGSGRIFPAGLALVLVLALCAADAGVASAALTDPVSDGFLAVPGGASPAPAGADPLGAPAPAAMPAPAPAAMPAPAPAAMPAPAGKVDDTSWGLLLRGGYFGLPNFIADELFVKHPEVTGQIFGAEIRYHGATGGRGVSSIGIAIDSAKTKMDGEWQKTETDPIEKASGDVSMLAVTLTGYWSLFPSWYVHPYIGIGIGVAHVKGFYKNEIDRFDADIWIPALHVPVGLAIELGKHVQLTAEGRFINGIAIGGAAQVRF